jgi:hypothetical protein
LDAPNVGQEEESREKAELKEHDCKCMRTFGGFENEDDSCLSVDELCRW